MGLRAGVYALFFEGCVDIRDEMRSELSILAFGHEYEA